MSFSDVIISKLNSYYFFIFMIKTDFKSINVGVGIVVAIALVVLIITINPFVQIGAGERGVVMNWGQVQDIILSEGLHTRIPFVQSVQKVSVRVQKSDVKTSGASKDLQDVGLELVINWKIDTGKVNKV